MADPLAPAVPRPEEVDQHQRGQHQIRFEHLDVEAEPDQHHAASSQRSRPVSVALNIAQAAPSTVSTSRLSIVLLRFVTTLIGVTARASAATSPAVAPNTRRTR